MYIQNAYYKAIPVTGATFPLAAGTIVTANGTVPASAEQYFGIVPEKVEKMPTTGYIFVAVSGTIDLDTCGVTFTDAQIKALGADFNFVRAKEEHEPPAPELPVVDSTDNGKVLKVVDGEWAAASGGGGGGVLVVKIYDNAEGEYLYFDKTFSEIETALSDGIPVYVMCEVQAENPDHNVFGGFFFSGASYYSALDAFAVGILDLSLFYEDIFTTSEIVFLADSASDTLKASYSQS